MGMLIVLYTILIAQILHMSLPTPSLSESEAPHSAQLDNWREDASCGVACCHILLRLNGLPTEFGDCKREIPIHAGGSTLLDMREGCRRLGLECEAISSSPSKITYLRFPFIAHLYPKESSEVGHYIVVLEVKEHSVTYIEPNWAATIENMPRSDFLASWSGNVLMPSPRFPLSTKGETAGWLTLAVLTVITFLYWPRAAIHGMHSTQL